MAMNYGNLKQVTLGEAGTVLVAEGAGVATGFIGGAFVGRQVQNLVKKDEEIVNATDKLLAWSANNVPKLAIWWMARDLREEGLLGTAIDDGRKAFAGSVVFDTLMRLTNGGKNPATASLFGFQILDQKAGVPRGGDVQRVLQENSALRTELNKALQRLAAQPAPRAVTPQVAVQRTALQSNTLITPEVAERQRRFGAMQQTPPYIQEREKRFGFMQPTPPAVAERERRFGFAGESMSSAVGFKNGENEGAMAKMSGFL